MFVSLIFLAIVRFPPFVSVVTGASQAPHAGNTPDTLGNSVTVRSWKGSGRRPQSPDGLQPVAMTGVLSPIRSAGVGPSATLFGVSDAHQFVQTQHDISPDAPSNRLHAWRSSLANPSVCTLRVSPGVATSRSRSESSEARWRLRRRDGCRPRSTRDRLRHYRRRQAIGRTDPKNEEGSHANALRTLIPSE